MNVVMSGIYFGGAAAEVLGQWLDGQFELLLSVEILTEYRGVAAKLSARYGDIGADRVLDLVTAHSLLVDPVAPTAPISRDSDDDKFIACAVC